MKNAVYTIAGASIIALALGVQDLPAQDLQDQNWWPSRWGDGDEAGASNWITPEKVLHATDLITEGNIYSLGRLYERTMPLRKGQRTFKLTIPTVPTLGPYGTNKSIFNDDFVVGELGQVGTQFDGLGHAGVLIEGRGGEKTPRFYNGFTAADLTSPYGLKRLGIEKVKPIFTRGVLVDVAALRGRMLERGEEITLDDFQTALERQGIEPPQDGDAVFFHTGWGVLWNQDNARYESGEPGVGLELAKHLARLGVSVVGADNWAVEVFPNPDPELRGIVHQELLVRNGIFLHENLDLSGLVTDQVYEFVYVFAPIPFKGATGSAGNPIAIR